MPLPKTSKKCDPLKQNHRTLVVRYFDGNVAKMAFRKLIDLKRDNPQLTVAYVYEPKSPGAVPSFLSSIHESSESNKSEESSDSEKKPGSCGFAHESGADTVKKGTSAAAAAEEEQKSESKAKELLEQKAAMIAQEYCDEKVEANLSHENNIPPFVRAESVPLMNTMPIPSHFLLGSQSPLLNSTTRIRPSSFMSPSPACKKNSFSEFSVNSDTLSEGPKINYPPRFPPPGFQYPHSPVFFHTESTANVDSDEALSSSGRFDNKDFLGSAAACYSGNPQLLRTQPIKKLTAPPPIHTHTKSYDLDHQFQFPLNPYLLPPSYPPQYYAPPAAGTYYDPNFMSAEEPLEPFYPVQPTTPGYGMHFMGPKGGRRRNPEKEEERGKFVISLENILNKKDGRTTLMVKNIPNKYNQKMLLNQIDETHKGQYDFFYLPIDFQNKCNVGYAFINFIAPIFIPGFYERFNGRRWEKFSSEKVRVLIFECFELKKPQICKLTYARIQGKQALQQHFQSSSIMNQQNKKVKPLILTVLAPSAAALTEYEKSVKQNMTAEKIRELERMNAILFGSK